MSDGLARGKVERQQGPTNRHGQGRLARWLWDLRSACYMIEHDGWPEAAPLDRDMARSLLNHSAFSLLLEAAVGERHDLIRYGEEVKERISKLPD